MTEDTFSLLGYLKALESKLRSDTVKVERLLDEAKAENTPFVATLAQKLDEDQTRLARLIALQSGDYSEQDLYDFLTPHEIRAAITIQEVFRPDRIQANLILASLYLTAFELLKNSLIQSLEDFFVPDLGMGDSGSRYRSKREQQYFDEVHVKFSTPGSRKLIPSCKWLQKNGVLSEDEVNEVKELRKHRNELAHELAELIIGDTQLVVDLERLMQIRELYRKVQLFWIRVDMDIQGVTEDISDEDISGGWVLLDLIINVALDYSISKE